MYAIGHLRFPIKRAFGIEIEMNPSHTQGQLKSIIASIDAKRWVMESGWAKTEDNAAHWHVKYDGTCGYKGYGRDSGWEIASYKAKGVKDLLNMRDLVAALKRSGVSINNNCGFHVHVEIKDLTMTNVASLMAHWLRIEDIVANILPNHRLKNNYCRMMRSYYSRTLDYRKAYTTTTFWNRIRPQRPYGNSQRRVAVNLVNYASAVDRRSNSRKTIEFRFPDASLDSRDVENWIRMLVNFVHNASRLPFSGSISSVGLQPALGLLGLGTTEGEDKTFYILSKGLWDTKKWFLERILKYSKSQSLIEEAVDVLNFMASPLDVYKIKGKKPVEIEVT